MNFDDMVRISYREGRIDRRQAVIWLMLSGDERMEELPVAERFSALKALKEVELDRVA